MLNTQLLIMATRHEIGTLVCLVLTTFTIDLIDFSSTYSV